MKSYFIYGDPPRKKFRLEQITVLVDQKEFVDIDLSCKNYLYDEDSLCQFSLLIGVNGVGKSTILRGIIDFFIDFKEYQDSYLKSENKKYLKKRKKHLQVVGVKYYADYETYNIYKNDNERCYVVNESSILTSAIPLPNIVASCFGVIDKFPIKRSFSTSTRINRYDVPMYSYVGARASSNIFSTVSALFQMLYYVLNLENSDTILRVKTILGHMGYQDRMTFVCKLRTTDTFNCLEAFLANFQLKKNSKTNGYNQWYIDNFLDKSKKEQEELFRYYNYLAEHSDKNKKEWSCHFEFNRIGIQNSKEELKRIYLLRQLGVITKTDCYLYKKGDPINCNNISSGELNMFCTVVGALSASELENALILIDEPEISQHPNWQMSIIDYLNEGLAYSSCHLLIATHSHFLVSDLPRLKSSVTYLSQDDDGLHVEKIKEETYGWSAEEVLLKVFKVSTTRNIYLAQIVGNLLDDIAHNRIDYSSAFSKINFLVEVRKNMNDIDPMKKIIDTIVTTFKNGK